MNSTARERDRSVPDSLVAAAAAAVARLKVTHLNASATRTPEFNLNYKLPPTWRRHCRVQSVHVELWSRTLLLLLLISQYSVGIDIRMHHHQHRITIIIALASTLFVGQTSRVVRRVWFNCSPHPRGRVHSCMPPMYVSLAVCVQYQIKFISGQHWNNWYVNYCAHRTRTHKNVCMFRLALSKFTRIACCVYFVSTSTHLTQTH